MSTPGRIVLGLGLVGLALLWRGPSSSSGPAELTIDSRPQGAAVSVNGRPCGVTPLTVAPLDPGRCQITLSLAGYAKVSTEADLVPGDRRFLSIPLTR